jgi:hypothetical protein
MAVRAGCWLRSDSIILDEPIQIDVLANRPPWLAVIMEDGYKREHSVDPGELEPDEAQIPYLERAALQTLDLGANYWALWTEADNLARFNERYPGVFSRLRRRLGCRVRPSWIWQRKRYGAVEVIAGIVNDGVAGVPGVLRVAVESLDGKSRVSGCLDAGHPNGGRVREASFILPREMFGQKLRMRAEIETKGGIRRPFRWSCEQPLDPEGCLEFQLLADDDKRWRKGI